MSRTLRPLRSAACLAGLALLSACGAPASERPRTVCSGTLKGGLERTFGTCAFEQIYRQNLDTLRLTASYDEQTEGGGAAYTTSAYVELEGEPRDGLTAEPGCAVTVKSNPQVWLAQRQPGVLGSCKLSFSEVMPYKQAGNTITYCILRGTLVAQLEADPSTPRRDPVPPINLSLTFDVAPNTADPAKQRDICDRQK